eukprot:4299998-Amphidinium_carterae.1
MCIRDRGEATPAFHSQFAPMLLLLPSRLLQRVAAMEHRIVYRCACFHGSRDRQFFSSLNHQPEDPDAGRRSDALHDTLARMKEEHVAFYALHLIT